MRCAIAVCLLAVVGSAVGQTTWYVDAASSQGPYDGTMGRPFRTIQSGIDAASDGDTVLLADGLYRGEGNRDLYYHGKAITLRSANGPVACIIDCQGAVSNEHVGFRFYNAETPASQLIGVTITGACAHDDGTIDCQYASPTIENCILTHNYIQGIECGHASPIIRNCTFTHNTSTAGSGILIIQGNPTVEDCIFRNNEGGGGAGAGVFVESFSEVAIRRCQFVGNSAALAAGVFVGLYADVDMEDCLFAGNRAWRGGGVAVGNGAQVRVTNCTFVDNQASSQGPGIACIWPDESYPMHVTVANSILTGENAQIFVSEHATVTVHHSDIRGGFAGEANIDLDPQFRQAGSWDDAGTPDDEEDDIWIDGDYQLMPTSPCIDAGDNSVVGTSLDLLGRPRFLDGDHDGQTMVDLGAFEYVYPVCGDGVLSPPEACDDGNTINNDGCENDCSISPHDCGNGIVEWSEACDDANDNNNDACLDTCVHATCGDGYAWEGVEACDDGNLIATDDCTDACALPFCGDAIVWAGHEACDDGNTVNTDDCLNACTLPTCGDGHIWQGHEDCDDGNSISGDGCENDCTITGSICGDGIVALEETCDDGNTLCFDGCSSICQVERTRYVDAATGNHDATGTIDDPMAEVETALFAARPGDTVLLADGTYDVDLGYDLDLSRKPLALRSVNGPDRCSVSTPHGWMVRPAAPEYGGGKANSWVFDGLSIKGAGSGIECNAGHPTIRNCIITAESTGISCLGNASPMVLNCLLTRNAIRAVFCRDDSRPTLVHCNIVATGGPAEAIYCSAEAMPTLKNCIVWDNPAGAFDVEDPTHVQAHHCCIQGGWPGEGNIDLDPMLIPLLGHLRADSPCIDAGTPVDMPSAGVDADGEPRPTGQGPDIGRDEFHDVDLDGLPDFWEQQYFDDPTAGAASEDIDDDGLDNAEEYAASRHPLTGPLVYHVAVDGNDEWDGLAPAWNGQHGPKASISGAIEVAAHFERDELVIHDGFHLLTGTPLAPAGRILTIRSANGPASCTVLGNARLWLGDSSDTVLEGLTFTGDTAGLYCPATPVVDIRYCSPTVRNCVIRERYNMTGIGLYASDATIQRCIIENNYNIWGAGIYCDGASTPHISDCYVANNCTTSSYADVMCIGQSSPHLTRCTLVGVDCPAMRVESGCMPVLRDCTLRTAGGYDVVFIGRGGDPTEPDEADMPRAGGTFVNCVFADEDPYDAAHVSLMSLVTTDVDLVNCTLVIPQAHEARHAIYAHHANVNMTNCILWGPLDEETLSPVYLDEGGQLSATYSCMAGGWPGEGNIDADPRFQSSGHVEWRVSPSGHLEQSWRDTNYRLAWNAPCINAGDPLFDDSAIPTDRDGRPRVRCGAVDIGAYEFATGDGDEDCDLDLLDLSMWTTCATAPGTSPLYDTQYPDTCTAMDADADGDIDLVDFARLQAAFPWSMGD